MSAERAMATQGRHWSTEVAEKVSKHIETDRVLTCELASLRLRTFFSVLAIVCAWQSRCTEALVFYNALASESVRLWTHLWAVVPKHHAVTHMVYDAQGVNPRAATCYQDEDMVGRVKRIYVACHGATAPKRTLQRYIILQGVRWRDRLLRLRTATTGVQGLPAGVQGPPAVVQGPCAVPERSRPPAKRPRPC